MVRWVLGIVLVAGIGWCGYWFVGARAVEKTARNWIDAQGAAGLEVGENGLTVAGFPNRFDLTMEAPHLANPDQGWGWRAEFLQIFSLSYKPWHVIAAFSPRQWVTVGTQEIIVEAQKLQASLVVRPNAQLPLQRIALVGDSLRLAPLSGPALRIGALNFATRAQDAEARNHRIGLEATEIAISGTTLPAEATALQKLRLDAVIRFSAPLDRLATTNPPRLENIEISEAMANWGEVAASANGSLQPGPRGLAEGQLTLRLENWQIALDRLATLGLIAAADLPHLYQAGRLLSARSGKAEMAELSVDFTASGIRLGGITVAPPLVLLP
ncbi:MAG: DUF2125 domain-containing protein [Pseudorhodobacter sp.]